MVEIKVSSSFQWCLFDPSKSGSWEILYLNVLGKEFDFASQLSMAQVPQTPFHIL